MIRLPQREAKTLLAVHGWSAVFLGLLLYAVVVTGVACVFAEEIGDWASPLPRTAEQAFPKGLDGALQTFAASVDPSLRESFFAYPRAGGRIYAGFHRDETGPDGRPTERGVAIDLDPVTLAVLDRREGDEEAMDAADTSDALAHFFVDLHVRLHVPEPWGLLLTGVLGLAMLVAAVSGFLVHRHLLRELFTLRRRRERLLTARDAHAVAGSWNLVFAFILAFTGSFFSFATSFGVPVMAMVAFNGDRDAAFDALVGNPPAEDARPAPMASIEAMLADAKRRAGAEPYFVSVDHWGRADARATVYMWPAAGRLTSLNYVYDGPSGDFRTAKPDLGPVPSAGGTLYALMAPLHFGNFAGLLSKAAWFALGVAAAYVTISGLRLWTARRVAQRGWRQLARAVTAVGYGLPLGLAVAAAVFFLARPLGAELQPAMMTGFLASLALAAAASWALPRPGVAASGLLALTGVALLALPALRLASGGPSWAAMLATGQAAVPAVDAVLVLGGLACLVLAWRGAAAAAPRPPAPEALRG